MKIAILGIGKLGAGLAERCCADHVKAAAVAALSMIEKSTAAADETDPAR